MTAPDYWHTLFSLAHSLGVSVETAWRRAVKHGWPVRLDVVRGVLIHHAPQRVVEGEWQGHRAWRHEVSDGR